METLRQLQPATRSPAMNRSVSLNVISCRGPDPNGVPPIPRHHTSSGSKEHQAEATTYRTPGIDCAGFLFILHGFCSVSLWAAQKKSPGHAWGRLPGLRLGVMRVKLSRDRECGSEGSVPPPNRFEGKVRLDHPRRDRGDTGIGRAAKAAGCSARWPGHHNRLNEPFP